MRNGSISFRISGFFMKKIETDKIIYMVMKKITSREEANLYYQKVNDAVDDFVKKTSARPTEVSRYLSKNSKRFLIQNDLHEIDGIETILSDVINHRKHMEKDKIVTFESFTKMNESFISLSEPSVDYEKILADKFNTSLGHIVLLDSELHIYKVEDFGKVFYASVLSENDIESIKIKLINNLIDEIKSQSIILDEVSNIPISKITFLVEDFCNNDDLESRVRGKIDSMIVFDFIKTILRNKQIVDNFIGPDNQSGYYIWFSELS